MDETALREMIHRIIKEEMDPNRIPIGVSNHHIHLTKEDFNVLFPNQEMTVLKPLKQPKEFASKQVVDIVGPKGKVEHVRVLGPCRSHSQVEIARSEALRIGVDAPFRLSFRRCPFS